MNPIQPGTEPRRAGVSRRSVAQAWIEPVADDPEAISALQVARRSLESGPSLRTLRRARLIEIEGVLPAAAELAARLHDSTRFYNPHKERCFLRVSAEAAAPIAADERAVLVFDRDGERRAPAERWWKRAGGAGVKVREGTAWVLAVVPGADGERVLDDLLLVRDARHGLLCNPHAQESRRAGAAVPLPWFSSRSSRVARGRSSA